LVDVDNASVAAAEPGDKLEYLGSEKGWGVAEEPSPGPDALEGSFSDPGAETSGDGMTTRITLTARDPSLNVLVDWGDGTGETARAERRGPNLRMGGLLQRVGPLRGAQRRGHQ